MRALALLLLLVPLTAGCAMFPNWGPQGSTAGRPYDDAEMTDVWVAAKEAFGVDWRTYTVNDTDYQIASDWDVQLAPMYRKGIRKKCSVWLFSDGQGRPYVEVQILREVNTDRDHPMQLDNARWEANGRDVEMERRILNAVDLRIGRVGAGSGAARIRPSPYDDDETEDEKRDRLWGDR